MMQRTNQKDAHVVHKERSHSPKSSEYDLLSAGGIPFQKAGLD